MANLPLPHLLEKPSRVTRRGPLTVNPSPPTEEAEEVQLSAADKQAKLMQWHYHLGHLTFPKLKQLALNGKTLKSLPRCCLPGVLAAFLVQ
jgi:hypothetical protein